MYSIKNEKFTIYFGGLESSFSVDEIAQKLINERLERVMYDFDIDQIVFLKQEHGVSGLQISDDDEHNYLFNQGGDYIFTRKKRCGIGVVTADCVPIVLYDRVSRVISIIHAGWKGLAAGILQEVIKNLIEKADVILHNLEIYIGPSAGVCCYEVQHDFIDKFLDYEIYFDLFFMNKDCKTFFDCRSFIVLIARNLGIAQQNIYTRYNVCTICNLSFCSYRREKEKARRQISIVCLH